MTFRNDVTKSENYARTGGGRGGLVAGGGIGALLLAGIVYFITGDPGAVEEVLGGGQSQNQNQESGALEECKTGADANARADCRVEFTGISVNDVWSRILPEQAGITYKAPGLTVFQNQVNTGCGAASANSGPFYCPGDHTAYFDVAFFDQLEQLGGDNAPFAQEYIVAHEFGHNVQALEGTLELSNYNQPGEDSSAVKIETQADCYAGIWAHHADKGENAMLEKITEQQVQDAIDTARAVGDDNIQKRSGGGVRPDKFTHGSSDARQKAFMAGYNTGEMKSCDFLGRNAYK